MYVLTAQQMRDWDRFTIGTQQLGPGVLMERAGSKCAEWIRRRIGPAGQFKIICGAGNNGGDGLVIGRLLHLRGFQVEVTIAERGSKNSDDFRLNLQRAIDVGVAFTDYDDFLSRLNSADILIDSIYGTGFHAPMQDEMNHCVRVINEVNATVISIDLPSGVSADGTTDPDSAVHATYTLSFQSYKPALLSAANAALCGEVEIIDIGLDDAFHRSVGPHFRVIDGTAIQEFFKPRDAFGHKGSFGHACLIAGGFGKMGAAVLSVKACLRMGSGLVTAHIPRCGYDILQTAAPEAMVTVSGSERVISDVPDALDRFAAIGVGPGIGTEKESRRLIRNLFASAVGPLVIDADALNCLGLEKDLLNNIPAGSILTPHPKEFDRMFGESKYEFDRWNKAGDAAIASGTIIIVKGHHSFIALPDGSGYFNNTGNAGMAKGGSGDVLTGMLTAVLAQGYAPDEAALLGVYLHGLAGDLAANALGQEAMTAADLANYFGPAFKALREA